MFLLGLHASAAEAQGVFSAVVSMLWRPRLFPAILTIDAIANSAKLFPTLCAADDLELLGNSDQIEFFSEFAVQNVEFGDLNFDLDKQTTSQYELPEFDFGASKPPAHVDVLNFSHFKLNMIGLHPQTYFNDFYPQKSSPQLVVSTDSSAAPLDDEFGPITRHSLLLILEVPPVMDYFDAAPAAVPAAMPSVPMTVPMAGQMAKPARKRKMSDEERRHSLVLLMGLSPEGHCRKVARQKTSFDCLYCDASFKVKGYLTRHLKKHNSLKAFVCPFYEEEGNLGTKCHPTGGFSRRDTYKTHLKALHFIYPPGTKLTERNEVGGRCAGCFEHFESNHQWLVRHIEVGECKGTIGAKASPTVKQEMP